MTKSLVLQEHVEHADDLLLKFSNWWAGVGEGYPSMEEASELSDDSKTTIEELDTLQMRCQVRKNVLHTLSHPMAANGAEKPIDNGDSELE